MLEIYYINLNIELDSYVDPTIEETRETHFYVDIERTTGAYAPGQTRAM